MEMYRPQCRKMVDQTKSFRMKNGRLTDEPCVRCSKCGLVYDCDHYKKLIKTKARGRRSKNKGNKSWRIRYYRIRVGNIK